MIKNEFQKIYKKIISQAPIFDKFDDQIIKPKLVKSDAYEMKLRMRWFFNYEHLDEAVYKITDNQSNLLYYQIYPLKIYNFGACQNFESFKIKTVTMNEYNTIDKYSKYPSSGTSIALQLSIIYLSDLSLFKSNWITQEGFVVERISRYFKNEEGIVDQLNETIRHYDEHIQQFHEEESKEEYINDINKGGIIFIYSIVDVATNDILYIDHDIFENKKFLTGMISPTIDKLKRNIERYFGNTATHNKIKQFLTNKVIEVANDY